MTVEGRRRNCRWYRGLGDSICFFSLLPIQIGIYNTYGWLLGWTRWLERFAYITCSWSGNCTIRYMSEVVPYISQPLEISPSSQFSVLGLHSPALQVSCTTNGLSPTPEKTR